MSGPSETAPPRSSEAANGWIEAARRIVEAVRRSDVSELEIVHGDFRVLVRRHTGGRPGTAPLAEPDAGADETPLHRIVAPLTGVFYRAPTPSAKPYVEEGDWVDADTVIGLVETMKIFNEVTADHPGRVVTFVAQAGQLVHTGEPLATLEPAERTAASEHLL